MFLNQISDMEHGPEDRGEQRLREYYFCTKFVKAYHCK